MLLFKNANIYTLDISNSKADSILVENGKIVEIGKYDELIKKIYPNKVTEIDLNGKTLIPSFNDSHVHFVNYGYNKKKIALHSCRSIEDIVKIGKNSATYNGWILGRGWNQDLFDEKRMPTKEDLDLISRDYPICFTRTCGHIAVVNTKALEICKIDKDTKCEGGGIDFENGIFSENALYLIYSHIPSPSLSELKDMVLETQNEFFSMGITSVQTDDFETFPDKDYEKIIKAYTELEKEGKLKIKVYEQCLLPEISKINDFKNKGYHFGYGDKNFKIGPIKLLLDGSLGGKTAYLQTPYINDEKNYGIVTYSKEEFEKIVTFADSLGYQIAVHSIGDGAIKMAIDSFKNLPSLNKKRHGIVHCQITTEELIKRLKELNILTYIQPIFLDYDLHIVEDRVGYHKSLKTYSWKTMYDLNIPMAFGSDAPVDSADVIKALHCAVNRQDLNFLPKDGWLPKEALSVEEALRCYTITSAFASFEENKKGSLEVGKAADFIILDKDIFKINKNNILDIKILMTVVDGEIVYQI